MNLFQEFLSFPIKYYFKNQFSLVLDEVNNDDDKWYIWVNDEVGYQGKDGYVNGIDVVLKFRNIEIHKVGFSGETKYYKQPTFGGLDSSLLLLNIGQSFSEVKSNCENFCNRNKIRLRIGEISTLNAITKKSKDLVEYYYKTSSLFN